MLQPDAESNDSVASYEALFRRHYVAVHAWVRRAWPWVDCDEVLSRTFEVAWRRHDQIPADAERGWLIAVARNCALNRIRSDRRRVSRIGSLITGDVRVSAELFDESVPAATTAALQRSFASLSDNDQEVLLLSAWGGLTGADLGTALGVSAGTAAVRLHRARSRLNEAFVREGSDPVER